MRKRIIIYLNTKGISKYKFYQETGLSNGFLDKDADINSASYEKISSQYKDLNMEWVRTGQGEMLKPQSSTYTVVGDNTTGAGSGNVTNNTTNNYNSPCTETPRIADSVATGRPYYDIDFLGGFGDFDDGTRSPSYYIDFKPFNKEGVSWCNIAGNSMAPELSSGDIVALQLLEDWRDFLVLGDIYGIVTTNNMRTIKRVRRGSSPEYLNLVPSNPAFEEQEIAKDLIHSVFRVLGAFKPF